MKTTDQILTEANKIKGMGSPLSIENIIKMIEKKEAKSSKKNNKKWERRDSFNKATKEINHKLSKMTIGEKTRYFEEVQRLSTLGQLPSSMR